jgi:hypothetical protein
MSATIYKIDKDTLLEKASQVLFIESIQSISVQHVHDNAISDEALITFEFDIAQGYVPEIEEEIVVVIRERVDATSRGPHDLKITNVGDDKGKPNYNQKVPYRPWELPQGFTELKGE